ncbi:DUF5605 domain-containing protein [Paenibacillus yanchengensis]|uniref:DUF5605 domain-containing protein n=1 Tax=Paenibacillus yanchengensis TaxID=2035833 RepID=A0ABW4YPC7_9BACL
MSQSTKATVEQWGMFELSLVGTSQGNPFVEVTVSATFRHEHKQVRVTGFYDGDGIYKVRFSPCLLGEWEYWVDSNDGQLSGQFGQLLCTTASGDNHGPVQVVDNKRFAYADGTPYIPVGTTSYGWLHQSEELQSQTLQTLQNSPFNKIRMCIIMNDYGNSEPNGFPFVGSREAGFSLDTFDTAFFARLEQRIEQLQAMQIEVDLIIFHPYDKGRWGLDRMPSEADDRYLRYVLARLSAYRNIWWSVANEYDFMEHKQMADWDRLLQIIWNEDPHRRLSSIHNGTKMYDHASVKLYDYAKPWITHCSTQHWDVSLVTQWQKQYNKPVVLDECCYEGNMERRWGNLSGEEMTRRFWDGVTRGAFVSHGETYLERSSELWLARGGELVGDSIARIAYMREIIEAAPAQYEYMPHVRDVPSIGVEGEYYLQYYGLHQPIFRYMDLPEGSTFRVEVIDTWNMEIVAVHEGKSGKFTLDLPGKPYIAVKMTKVGE